MANRAPGLIYQEALAAYEVVNTILTREEEYRAINSPRGPETYVSNIPKLESEYESASNVLSDKISKFYAAVSASRNDWTTESEDLAGKKSDANRRYYRLIRAETVLEEQYEPRRFAGVYFSDGHDPVEIRKTEQTKRAAEMYCGVVAVSGVVPLLCCDADIDVGRFTRGTELFLALRTKTGGRYTESTDYCQIVRPDKEDNVYPMDEVAFATSGEFSHQQLAVAPVCLKPPEPPSADSPNGVVWGCPRFAPVVLEAGQPDMYPSVTGAVHAGARGSLNVGNVFTQSGARVFRIVNRATLLASANSFNGGGGGAAALDDDARAKLLEDHFIGTFVSKIGDGGGCMVRLGALLLRTA